MLAFLAISSAYPGAITSLLHGKVDRLPVGLFLCAVAGFEFHVLYATEKMLRNGTRPSAARGYGYAFVETSLPTLVIVYYATLVGPAQALLMPSAFVYFIFILLSTLRLDFALSAFTGLVAATEYAAVALFWSADSATTPAPTRARRPCRTTSARRASCSSPGSRPASSRTASAGASRGPSSRSSERSASSASSGSTSRPRSPRSSCRATRAPRASCARCA